MTRTCRRRPSSGTASPAQHPEAPAPRPRAGPAGLPARGPWPGLRPGFLPVNKERITIDSDRAVPGDCTVHPREADCELGTPGPPSLHCRRLGASRSGSCSPAAGPDAERRSPPEPPGQPAPTDGAAGPAGRRRCWRREAEAPPAPHPQLCELELDSEAAPTSRNSSGLPRRRGRACPPAPGALGPGKGGVRVAGGARATRGALPGAERGQARAAFGLFSRAGGPARRAGS